MTAAHDSQKAPRAGGQSTAPTVPPPAPPVAGAPTGPATQSPTKAQTAGDPPPQADPKSLTFFDHLSELRRRLIACLAAVAILTLASWNFAEPILALIMDPVLRLLPDGSSLIYSGLPDAFSVTFKVSLWTGAVLSAPFCLYQIWAFVAPGLMPDEKAKVPTLTVLASVLFLAGLAFAYFLAFPITFGFFLKFSSETMRPLLAVDRYMSLVMSLALAFALSFQLPLALTFLARLGLVTPAFLRKQRAYAIVAIFILAAVLTPPDVISQIVLAAALMALYELSIFLVLRETHARERALANSLAEAADSDSAAHSDPDDTD